jgi:hypothetical protein
MVVVRMSKIRCVRLQHKVQRIVIVDFYEAHWLIAMVNILQYWAC